MIKTFKNAFFSSNSNSDQNVSSCFNFYCELIERFFFITKRMKSKNRMQITEFPARLSQHKRVLREIQGM